MDFAVGPSTAMTMRICPVPNRYFKSWNRINHTPDAWAKAPRAPALANELTDTYADCGIVCERAATSSRDRRDGTGDRRVRATLLLCVVDCITGRKDWSKPLRHGIKTSRCSRYCNRLPGCFGQERP